MKEDSSIACKVAAIDIELYRHGIWCSIGEGDPFVNTITNRRWNKEGTKIHFMLESLNSLIVSPDEMVEVCETNEKYVPTKIETKEEFLSKRPYMVEHGAGI